MKCVIVCTIVWDVLTVTQSTRTWGERLMSGNAAFLAIFILSLRAEVVAMAQQDPQSAKLITHNAQNNNYSLIQENYVRISRHCLFVACYYSSKKSHR